MKFEWKESKCESEEERNARLTPAELQEMEEEDRRWQAAYEEWEQELAEARASGDQARIEQVLEEGK